MAEPKPDVPEWMHEICDGEDHPHYARGVARAIAAHPEFVEQREKAEALDIVAAGDVELEVADTPQSPRCRAKNGGGPWHYGDSPADVIQRARAQEPT